VQLRLVATGLSSAVVALPLLQTGAVFGVNVMSVELVKAVLLSYRALLEISTCHVPPGSPAPKVLRVPDEYSPVTSVLRSTSAPTCTLLGLKSLTVTRPVPLV
jgi:hypothetical protein